MKFYLGKITESLNFFDKALCVFVYHDVSSSPSMFNSHYEINIPPDIFRKQMEEIKAYFNVINPDQLLDDSYDKPAALVTFDDGCLSYFKEALPILEELKIPSINFVNMGSIEGKTFWPGLIAYCYS